ncbi:ABC transporter permease subunit [Caldilinea sp.]|uniref:ABC transporter permease subunit n=1 Tax=Caldilinea sp. TaxID=2293560 RepID=UPI0021DC9567|nr:ABC transporter permease subunit [Caldilinea sp.]GIV69260.1 MAG: ABC transporter permease [Caldilinea sp.]
MKHRVEHLFLAPFLLFLAFFELYPLTNMTVRSFLDETSQAFTLRYYLNIFTQPHYVTAIRNSLLFASACSLVGAVAGTFVGYIAVTLPRNQRNFLLSLYSLPLTLSGLVVAFAFIVLLGRNGVLNLIVQRLFSLPRDFYFDIYSWPGLVVVYSFYQVPLMTLTMAAVFENLDRSLLEASRNLGAKPWQTWRYIIIPILAPGFLAGLSIQLAGMLGAFGTVLALVGGAKNLLSIQIYYHTSESTYNLPQAAALSITLIILIGCVLYALSRMEKKLRPGG